MAQRRQRVQIGARELTLSNLDKVLWPDCGLTKADLIDYLVAMAPYLLPHLRRRPLVLTRYPDGAEGEWFYQKNTPDTAPPWIPRWPDPVPGPGGRTLRYLVCEEVATLAWLGNQAAIELHPWYSRIDAPDRPTMAVIDLDPTEGAGFDEAREVAFVVKRLLDELGLRACCKTSGASGLHVYIPIDPVHTYEDVVAVTRAMVEVVAQAVPGLTTLARRVAERPRGRVYLDYLQNGRGKTLSTVYGPRPRPGAPVSCPIAWEELATVRPEQHTIATMPARAHRLGDLFAPVQAGGQDLFACAARLGAPLPRDLIASAPGKAD